MALILLVEDEPWLGELYSRLLTKAGHTVQWCTNNYDAIDFLDSRQPQLLLLDLLLPWSNGLQLLHELASYGDTSSIPTILCTNALPKEATTSWMHQYGVRDIFNKTEEQPKQLLQKVNQVLAYAHFSD